VVIAVAVVLGLDRGLFIEIAVVVVKTMEGMVGVATIRFVTTVAMATVAACVRPMDRAIMAVVTVVIADGLVLIRFHPLTTGLNASVESFWAAADKSTGSTWSPDKRF
jgi:hypothetical protein